MRPDYCDRSLSASVATLMRQTARIEITPRFRRLLPSDSREKAPGDWVTVADEAAEHALRHGLLALLPGAVTVGEEEVAADSRVLLRLAGEKPVWIIDPVDGTRLFRDGIDGFGIIVALACKGQVTMGWILDCCTGYLVHAVSEAGACEIDMQGNQTPLDHSPWLHARQGHASSAFFRGRKERILNSGGAMPAARSFCSTADYVAMSRGESAFTIAAHDAPWDHAAGALMVCELGGTAQCLDGSPYLVARHSEGIVVARQRAWRSSITPRLRTASARLAAYRPQSGSRHDLRTALERASCCRF